MDRKYFNWISCLRGGCSVIVVLRHLWPYIEECTSNPVVDFLGIFVWRLLDSGKVGVVGFFLISGFLLPKSLSEKTRTLFITDRLIRLYPTYWFSMLLAIIFVGGFGLKQILVNLTMLQTFVGVDDLVGVYWTMSIEIVLYIGCLIFFNQIKEQNLRVIDILYGLLGVGSIGLSFLRMVTEIKLPVALPLMLFVAFVGYYLRLYNDQEISIRHLALRLISFVVVLLPSCIMAYNMDMGFNERWYVYFLSYIAGLLIFVLFMRKNINVSVLYKIGGISYSLYLTHRVVISSMCDKGQNVSLLYLLLVVLIIAVLAVVTNMFIEKKSYTFLKKKLTKGPTYDKKDS